MKLQVYSNILKQLKQTFPQPIPHREMTAFDYGKQRGHLDIINFLKIEVNKLKELRK
jgi:hypothetical protein